MKRLVYLVSVFLLYPLSLLPLFILYIGSDLFYFFLYKVFGYRLEVVRTNLKKSFPQKSHEDLQVIERRFYHNLCDVMVESVKSLTISKRQIENRVTLANPEVLEKYFSQNISIIVVTAHYGNWEWSGLRLSMIKEFLLLAVYLRQSNQHFNRLLERMRERFGMVVFPADMLARNIVKHRNKTTMTVLIGDQSPGNIKNAYWTSFLNQDTAINAGPEKMAKTTKRPVLFGENQRIKRGHYTITFTPLIENPEGVSDTTITFSHAKHLENLIKNTPDNWLWSHKRWKRKRPSNQDIGKSSN